MDRWTRREFLKTSGLVIGGAGAGLVDLRTLYGQTAEADQLPPTLVVLYLRGGADVLNAIIPATESLYYTYRPTIAIPREQVLPVTNRFGFHPAMRELHELYQAGRLAAIINAGSTHPTRSHFDAQDFMERAAPGIKTVTEGWLNRYLTATRTDEDRDLRSVSLQPTLPRSLRGDYPVLAVPDGGAEQAMSVFETLYGCNGEKEAIAELRGGDHAAERIKATLEARGEHELSPAEAARQQIVDAGAASIAKLRKLNALLHNEDHPVLGDYPSTHLGRQFRSIARLIKSNEGLEIAALDYGGWDHHAYQGGAQGVMTNMLMNLSKSMRAFHDDLGPRMNRTVVLVMSEFGRTARENGNNGTDHGRGGFMLALGGPVVGGKVYGKWRGLSRKALYEGRDMPVHTDFRDVFAETLSAMYGFRSDRNGFFPEYRANDRALGMMNPIAQA